LLGSDQFFGQPANPEDPLLDTYPGTATGVSGQDGGGGLVQICFNGSCPPSFATIDVASCESFADPLGAVYNTSGTYSYVLTSATGCDSVVTLNLTINPSPAGSITTTPDSCLQTTYPFSVSSDSAITSISWDFGDPASGDGNTSDAITPSHAFSAVGTYQVTAIVDFSCGADTLSTTLTIVSCDSAAQGCSLFFPNVFSPNADGLNDGFRPLSACGFDYYDFLVFDRWGQLLYQTSNPEDEWDGVRKGLDCPSGVYAYRLTYKFPGLPASEAYGDVALIR
jgi:gliding motility-associated-like protein